VAFTESQSATAGFTSSQRSEEPYSSAETAQQSRFSPRPVSRCFSACFRNHSSGSPREGTIGGEEADESNNSVVVMVISSDELRWTSGLAKGLSANSRAVGQEVAQSLSSELGADDVGLTSAGFIPDSSRRAKVGIPDKRCATESVVVRKEEPM